MDSHDRTYMSRAKAYELSEDVPSNTSTAPTIGDVIAKRFGRRDVMRGALAVTAVSALGGALLTSTSRPAMAAAGTFNFEELPHGGDETHHVAPGYTADILIRWGDPVVPGAPAFDPMNQTADAQEQQFGYNNDYVGFVPLPYGSGASDRGLLCVNHEYTNEELMFPGIARQGVDAESITQDLVDIEMAAHGGSVIEIMRGADGKWMVVPDSEYNRRISARSTPMMLSGPAAGHDRLKTSEDSTGTQVIGTINNCAGGITPWGTYLMAEENFHGYFWGELGDDHPEKANYERYGVPGLSYAWGRFHKRFNINEEPNEANRFGWIVEVDPLDPASTPVKRTALGRYKHEGAESIVNSDGRVVVYMGDDERFDYVYRFVTAGTFNPDDRAANMSLLDEGTLSVARYDADGTVHWLPLVHGEGPLTEENGFSSQADVVIESRRASDLLGATPMDRPEDVEPNPMTNKVYVMLTNNSRRTPEQVNAANPRPDNEHGHIVEMTPPDGDHTADTYTWEILVKCGNPNVAEVGAMWNPATSDSGWFADPDNCAIDHQGRLWVSTDGNSLSGVGTQDGLWALETEGELRGKGMYFFRVPAGAELCGPLFTPDDRTLFLAVQHPADDGEDYPGFERPSTFEDPRIKEAAKVSPGTTRHFPAIRETINNMMGSEPDMEAWPQISNDIIPVELGRLLAGQYDSPKKTMDTITEKVNEVTKPYRG